MRVPLRTQYATRALYELALLHDKGGAAPPARAGERGAIVPIHGRQMNGAAAQAPAIAKRQRIPLAFLERILQDLRKASLVVARRGPRGGYALARPPAEISLADILRATAGGPARRAGAHDVVTLAWQDASARMFDTLAATTLADLLARAEAAGQRSAPPSTTMYFI
jgi:Rrf2 family protein